MTNPTNPTEGDSSTTYNAEGYPALIDLDKLTKTVTDLAMNDVLDGEAVQDLLQKILDASLVAHHIGCKYEAEASPAPQSYPKGLSF